MKQYVQAKATKVEEKKDPETGAISYRVILETVETITVNSLIKPEIGNDLPPRFSPVLIGQFSLNQ